MSAKKVAICIAIACVLLIGGGAAAYYIPTTYVSLDVNPSIEYSVNMFKRVISVKGVNDDGTEIIDEIALGNLRNKSIEEAISLTVEEMAREGYLDGEGAGIVIATSANNMTRAGELAQELENAANVACAKANRTAVVNAEAVGKGLVKEAKNLGVTPGKLQIVEKMMESAGEQGNYDKNEWLNKPVRDILAQMEQNSEQEYNAGEETQNTEQNQNSEANGSGSSASGSGSNAEPPSSGSGSSAGSSGTSGSGGSGTEPPSSGSGATSGNATAASGSGSGTTPSSSGTTGSNGSGTEPPSSGSGTSGSSGTSGGGKS